MNDTKRMAEDTLKSMVIELAGLTGWLCYSLRRSDRALVQGPTAAGFPDLILVRGDRVLAVELKSEKGRLRESQKAWLDALDDTHVVSCIWRPFHWNTGVVEEALK